eukprot:gene3571-6306_t
MSNKRSLEDPREPNCKKTKTSPNYVEIYEKSLELYKKEKISEKNLWKIELLEHFTDLLEAKEIFGTNNSFIKFNFEAFGILLELGSTIYSNRIDSIYDESIFIKNKFNRSTTEKKNTTQKATSTPRITKEQEISKNFDEICNNLGKIESNLRIFSNNEASNGLTSSLFVNKLSTMNNNSIFELFLDFYEREGNLNEENEENITIPIDLLPNIESPRSEREIESLRDNSFGNDGFETAYNYPAPEFDDEIPNVGPTIPSSPIPENVEIEVEQNSHDISGDDFMILIEESSQEITISPSTSTSKKTKKSPNCWKPQMSSSQIVPSNKTLSKKSKRNLDFDERGSQRKKKCRDENSSLRLIIVDSPEDQAENNWRPMRLVIDNPIEKELPFIPTFDDEEFDPVGFQDDEPGVQQEKIIQQEEEITPIESFSVTNPPNQETLLEKEKKIRNGMWEKIKNQENTYFSEILKSDELHDEVGSNFVSLLHLAAQKGLSLENENNEELSDILIKNCKIIQ